MNKNSYFITLLLLLLTSYLGYRVYRYATYKKRPVITVKNLLAQQTIHTTRNVAIIVKSGYAIDNVQIQIDGKTIKVPGIASINAYKFFIPFILRSKLLTDGRHTLTVTATDKSYHKNQTTLMHSFYSDNRPLILTCLPTKNFYKKQYMHTTQGSCLLIKIQANKKLADARAFFLGATYELSPSATHPKKIFEGVIPVDCEEATAIAPLAIEASDYTGCKKTMTHLVKIKKRKHQHSDQKTHVPEHAVQEIPEFELSLTHKHLRYLLDKHSRSSEKKLWDKNFILPLHLHDKTTITKEHGMVLSSFDTGRHVHKGITITVANKQPVWASARGRIVAINRYMHNGNTIVIDHGNSVVTVYSHLDQCNTSLSENEIIDQGTLLGLSRTKLHFEVLIKNKSIDPIEWCQEA